MPVPPPASHRRRMRRHLAVLGALLAGALLATGCFRVEISIDVEDDGTGTASFLTAMESETLDMMGDEGASESFLDEFDESGLPGGASVEAYDQDGFVGQRVSFPFTHEGDVAAALAASGGEDTPFGTADDPFDEFELRREGDQWILNAAINVGNAMGEEFSAEDEMMRGFFESASFTVRIKMPGRVLEHNADRQDGDGALIWDLDVLEPTNRALTATSDPSQASAGGGGSNTMLIVGIIVAVVVVAAIVAFVMMRRRPAGGAPAAGA